MIWMSPKLLGLLAGSFLILVTLTTGQNDFDKRVPVQAGAPIEIDLELTGGIASDHGSLQIRSHDGDDVHVSAEISGWARWAVELELEAQGDGARLRGRVDSHLAWLFGGPTADITVEVPRASTLAVRIEGGPLLLEDLAGPITATVNAADVTLRRADGAVHLTLGRGDLEVEDVEGDLTVRSERGHIEVAGVGGAVEISAGHGSVEIESVEGPVRVVGGGGRFRGHVKIDSVRGPVIVETDRGKVELEDVRGDIRVVTNRGRIEAENIDGAAYLRSSRGSIKVEFDGSPRGDIETGRGSIDIQVPEDSSFDLDARTERGEISVGDPDDWAIVDLGGTGSDESRRGRWRGESVLQAVNGGGQSLKLRTGRGSIRIDD